MMVGVLKKKFFEKKVMILMILMFIAGVVVGVFLYKIGFDQNIRFSKVTQLNCDSYSHRGCGGECRDYNAAWKEYATSPSDERRMNLRLASDIFDVCLFS